MATNDIVERSCGGATFTIAMLWMYWLAIAGTLIKIQASGVLSQGFETSSTTTIKVKQNQSSYFHS